MGVLVVRAFPDTGGKWQISNVGGSNPVWSHNGRELFFRSEDNRIMVAAYTAKGDSFARTSRACGPTRNSRASLGSAA